MSSKKGRPYAKKEHPGARASQAQEHGAAKHRAGVTRWTAIASLAAVLAATFVVYLPSLDNEFTNWDDNYYVTENRLLANPDPGLILTTPVAGNFHPLTIASLALNYQISGWRPSSYRWLSLLLHVANTALVFLFVWTLTGRKLWSSLATALFFGIHPMHVESVAWIAERKDVLYAFFYLISLIAYVRYLDSRSGGGRMAGFAGSILAFILSAASKPAAVVLPLTLLAIDFLRRRPMRAILWVEKVPFVLVSVAVGILTLMAQRSAGALAAVGQWTLFQKVLFATYGSVMYVVKFFLPVGLSAVYPYPRPGMIGPEYYICFAVFVVALPLLVYSFRHVRPVLFGLAFFFINIVLVLQLINIGNAVMADRYTYLPYIGLMLALAWWLDAHPAAARAGHSGAWATPRWLRPAIAAVFLAMLPLCLAQTWRRCDVWQNSGTLWNDTIARYPGRVFDAYNNRGYYRLSMGQREEALADFNQALAINPTVPRAWVNKGDVFAEMSQDDSAYICFDRAIALKPDLPEALSNRGAIKYRRGDAQGALSDLSSAIEWDPGFRDAYSNRAFVYAALREYEKSIADRRKVIALDPRNPRNYVQSGSIGTALVALGRHREAVESFGEAIAGAPAGDWRLGGYYLRRSFSWKALGDRSKALSDAREAAKLGAKVEASYLKELEG